MSDVKNAQEGPRVEPAWDRNQPARDETRPGGTSGEPDGISGADWLLYGAIAVVALGIGVVNALSAAQDLVWHGGAYDVRTPLFWEISSIVTIILLAPLLFVAVRRLRDASGWLLRIALAAAAILVFSALHIAGMVGLRKMVMFLAGGSYDFHLSVATVVYEFRKDVVTCLLIGGSLWLIAGRREAQPPRSVPATAPADLPSPATQLVWLRDGSARIRIEPRDILWISSAGNYVEYFLEGGRTHLVRGTLAGEEARLTKFNIARVHRTRLVNLSRVIGLTAGPNGDFELTLDAGQAISGSRRYRGAISSIEALASAPASVSSGNDAHP
ncbi:MAG: LytTR family DNA-binding domain-containing protein [Bradyrhizobium sp.]